MSDHPAGIETLDRHTSIDPRCPVCGSQDFSKCADEPESLRYHYVGGPCGDCGALVEIEYVAVDVWYNTGEARRSGVADGLVPTSTTQYLTHDENEGEMPSEARERFESLWGTEYPTPDDAEASD